MSNFDPNYAAPRGVSADRTAAEIDQGLRSYMLASTTTWPSALR